MCYRSTRLVWVGGLYFPFYNITLQPTASARLGQLSVLLIERKNELWVAIV